MLLPVVCASCGLPIGHHWETFTRMLHHGYLEQEALYMLGLVRECCRRTLLTAVPTLLHQLPYAPWDSMGVWHRKRSDMCSSFLMQEEQHGNSVNSSVEQPTDATVNQSTRRPFGTAWTKYMEQKRYEAMPKLAVQATEQIIAPSVLQPALSTMQYSAVSTVSNSTAETLRNLML